LTADRGSDVEGRIIGYKPDGSFIQEMITLKTAADKKPLPAEVFNPWQNGMTV
jgi:hypothetical protein